MSVETVAAPGRHAWIRRVKNIDLTAYLVVLVVLTIVLVFLVYPVSMMVLNAFVPRGQDPSLGNLTLANFARFFSSSLYSAAVKNSLIVTLGTVLFACVIGVPTAYVVSRVAIPFKTLVTSLITLSLILPPFIGTYAWIQLLGRNGLFNHLLGMIGVSLPPLYGPFGIILTMSIGLYPFVFLLTQGALSVSDPHLEESAEIMGANFLTKVRTITLPLVIPAVGTGAVIVFMRAIGNFGVPAVIGGNYYVLPTLTYFQIMGFNNLNAAAAISLVTVLFSICAMLALRYFTLKRRFSTLTSRIQRVKQIEHPVVVVLCSLFILVVLLVSLAPHMVILVSAFSTWSATLFPTAFHLQHFKRVFTRAWTPIQNGLFLSGLSTLLCVVLGIFIAYISVKGRFRGRWMLDVMVMLPFLLPGIVVGVAILTAFISPPLVLVGTWMILAVAFFIRRLPYIFRASTTAIAQIDPALEESSTIMGASWLATIARITTPLIAPGVLAGALITFTTLMGELSATMILYSARWKTAPVAIYEYLTGDLLGPASALGAIILVVVLTGLLLANRLIGGGIAALFRSG